MIYKGKLVSTVDFLFFPFCRFVEPEPIPWFPKWSSGKFLVLLWSFFTLIIVHSFQGNLRANLISKEFEKPITTHQDVLDRGQTVFFPTAVMLLR